MQGKALGRSAVCALAVCAVLTGAVPAAAHEPEVVPADNPLAQAVYDELAGLWWQWALAVPAPTNPVTDTTGEHCAEGQFKPVWFLAGTLEPTAAPVERRCRIPAGRFVFFPVANTFEANDPGGDRTFDDVLATVHERAQEATGTVTIDGETVAPFSAESRHAFSLTLPADNVFQAPSGVYEPAAAAGLHVLLMPLRRGRHEIHIQGSIGGSSVDVVYHLKVSRRP
jgi:hypothetical protein